MSPVDVLAVLDAQQVAAFERGDTDAARAIGTTRVAVAELQRLTLAIDEECGNAKPNFGRVVKLAAEAAALARVGGAK